ncbi:MAG: type I restriction endonuclease subunit R [Bacteroidetes bacterium]|nr:type I restriction endonuclease subunit R [Bacteroidota bacterium]
MSMLTEKAFEENIEHWLLTEGGWKALPESGYDKKLALFPDVVFEFLEATQSKALAKLAKIHGTQLRPRLLSRLSEVAAREGILSVLRNGFSEYGIGFRLAYFAPETNLNPETLALYAANHLGLTRQLHYSEANHNSIDLVFSLNGIPLATAELKNLFTGQGTAEAQKQYMTDRDPAEPLLRFGNRTLVHFAVDAEQVFMTTRLNRADTVYLPFNRGYQLGAGNPPAEGDYRTAYLWNEVLERHSFMDIAGKFLMQKRSTSRNKLTQAGDILFPRYHQLDAVRRITAHVRTHGAGQHYLIQHSAGSGKSNSIAWLAYRLSTLHNAANQKCFDTVVVITDRNVLDQQLQETIESFDHTKGTLRIIDKDSAQLADALMAKAKVVVTTLQKFPHILDKVSELGSNRFAIIIDEAHSSQGGKASNTMKRALGEAAVFGDDDPEEEDVQDELLRTMQARGKQTNMSLFAFTATPKARTLEVFGTTDYMPAETDENGRIKPHPFHLYSMRQAIEERFILDVLTHYTTYSTFYRLAKKIEEDPELNPRKAQSAILNYVSLHPHNIQQKTEIMIEHFRSSVQHLIGGKAKAMLVTQSREHAYRYFMAFGDLLRQKGITDMDVLVAFSGKLATHDYPEGITEAEINGFGEKQLPEQFAGEKYKLLIVADKYQTGFDQPLLHTMYVDKALSGVKAVQTLSRLNRTHPGKENTFVLDFRNTRDDILAAFQPYYELTTVEELTDPNLLFDLRQRLDSMGIYRDEEVEAFAGLFFSAGRSTRDQSKLYAFLQPATDRYVQLSDDEKNIFKRMLRQWSSLYAFLAQIIPFNQPALERFYVFAQYLHSVLPGRSNAENVRVADKIALQYFRIRKQNEGAIELEKGSTGELRAQTGTGTASGTDRRAALSEIIQAVNARFGINLSENDSLFLEQNQNNLRHDQELQQQALSNSEANFGISFNEKFRESLAGGIEANQQFVNMLFENKEVMNMVMLAMMKETYAFFRGRGIS